MARKPMKSYGPKQRIGKIRGKKSATRRRNNLGRTVDLGFEMLEPKWVLASPGSLDPTFDLDGLVVGEFGSSNVKLTSMAVQNDGKVVVAGTITTAGDPTEDIVVARFNVNGSLDTTFGDNDSIGGYTTFTFNGGQSFAWDVALDSSGNVIVAGQGRNVAATALGFGVARLGSDGELDGTFGTGGMAVSILGSVNSEARGVAIQSDGKIVLAGTEFKANATPTRNDFAVARYNTNGTLDTSFGGTGTVVTDFNGRGDAAFDVVIQKVGLIEKILVGGEADRSGSAINDFGMVRYNPNGTLDTAIDGVDTVEFGVGGKVTTVAGTGALAQQTAQITGIALDSLGRIVVGGTVGDINASQNMAVGRYSADGLLDTATFNSSPAGVSVAGVRHIDFSTIDFGNSLLIQPDGQIVIGGYSRSTTTTTTSTYRWGLARLNATNGSLDSSFGTGGLVQVPAFLDAGGPDPPFEPAEPDDVSLAKIALTPDGKIVGAGYQDLETTDADYLLARYETGLVVSSISGPATVAEAATYTLTTTSGDPTTTQWTINWGDSIQVVPGNPSSVMHVYADGPNNYTISATITTSTGTFAVGNTVAVTVTNVVPTLAISGGSDLNEGSSYTLSLSSSDVGPDTITSWTINWGDGTQVVAGNPSSVSHTYADGNASYSITASATDEDGTYSAGSTVAVTVHNVAPTLAISGATDVNEGSSYALNLTSSDPGADTITSWTINWGDSTQIVAGNPSSVSHTYADGDANYVISATATDEDSTFAAGNTVAVSVHDVAPTLAISGASDVNEGSSYSLSLSSADVGTDTITCWTINWGDSVQVVSGNPSSVPHTYADGSAGYTISATAANEDGTFAAGNSVGVTVHNVAPTLTIGGAASVSEGSLYTLNLSSSDPGADTITSWTINWGDSLQVVSGNPASVTHTYADGTASYSISATATDEDGTYSSNTVAVTVNNVAPTLTISGAASVNEGSTYTLNLSSSDPGADTIASWTINWGDGTQVVSGNPSSVTHVYADGTVSRTISATATDEDGTFAAGNTVSVTVNNVAPTLAISGAASVSEGSTYTLNLTSSDPGADTITSWTINWGDGTQVVSGHPANVAHVYADGNGSSNYTITATATDEDGTYAAGNTVAVTVANVAPTANTGGPYQTFEDTPVVLSGSGSDPAGAADPLTFKWDLDGDGIFGESGAGATRANEVGANVTYNPTGLGNTTQTVKLQVSDGDGGVTVSTTTVQIQGQGTLLVGGVLYIVGSNSSDIVAITKVGNCIVVLATFNSNNPMTFNESAVTDIQVRMRSGNDIVVTTPNVTKTMTIDGGNGNDLLTGGGGRNLILGGSGNDVLYGDGGDDVLLGGTGNDDLFGGSGNDVLVGGDGNDVLRGGTGRDVLIGSQDDDCLDGGADEDVLIGGVTIHDNNVVALDAVMAIWGSSASFSSRVATLTGSGGLLQAGVAVFDDDDNDSLNGGAGRDLYFGDNNPWDGAVDSISLQALQDQLIAVT